MNKDINPEVGVSRAGFVAERAGKVLANAEAFDELMEKESVKKLLGDKTVCFKHVIPPGMTRATVGASGGKEAGPQALAKAIMESGMPFRVVEIEFDPEIDKAVTDYVMGIEEAHHQAAKSKLHFGAAVA